MSAKQLKVAVIGCNGIALQKTLPSLARCPEVEIAAFCDTIKTRAQSAAERFGCKNAQSYSDYREMLMDSSIDIVHICTPNTTHAMITIDALDAGKHVMCEKPMATSTADALGMLEASARNARKLSISYQNRFRKDVQTLKQYCGNGDLGEIYFAKAHALRRRGVPTWGVFLNETLQGGGPLVDIGTHSLDLALWLMNDYNVNYVVGSTYHKLAQTGGEANLFGKWDVEKFTVEDSAFAFIMMNSGATIVLESSWALNILDEKEAKVTLCGTKAGADMNDGLRINGEQYGDLYTKQLGTGKQSVDYFSGSMDDPGYLEARSWIDCILYDSPPLVHPAETFVVTQILEAIYQSAIKGKPVIIK